jgi:chemotaxis protein methyltransferase WspC
VSVRAVDTVVRERLGLDPAALGPNALGRAIDARMRAAGVTDLALYAARLVTEAAERDGLAAELAVSETWFFRGGVPLFERLAGFVADRAAGRPPGTPARALSVPCSTGEEPYSLAIALHERRLARAEVAIDAADVSAPVVARAAAARYGAFSFRETGPDVRPVYFNESAGTWELLPHLRAAVHFRTANLTDPRFLADQRAYDLILCRNLFIYLTPDARLRALANLDRLLAPDGLLCVTPAEADRLPPGRFVPDGATEFGIYRRAAGAEGKTVRAPARITRPPVPVPAPPAPVLPDPLGAARALADAGRLDEARTACEALICARPADADALALLGVVHLAAGRAGEAFDALGKALYLAPDHAEGLAHMATLCDRRGDRGRAAALRRRLARLHPPGPQDGP